MQFIDIYRDREASDASSLQVSEPAGSTLRVVGVLPHGSEMQPRTIGDARQLITWLEAWILNAHEAELKASVSE